MEITRDRQLKFQGHVYRKKRTRKDLALKKKMNAKEAMEDKEHHNLCRSS